MRHHFIFRHDAEAWAALVSGARDLAENPIPEEPIQTAIREAWEAWNAPEAVALREQLRRDPAWIAQEPEF